MGEQENSEKKLRKRYFLRKNITANSVFFPTFWPPFRRATNTATTPPWRRTVHGATNDNTQPTTSKLVHKLTPLTGATDPARVVKVLAPFPTSGTKPTPSNQPETISAQEPHNTPREGNSRAYTYLRRRKITSPAMPRASMVQVDGSGTTTGSKASPKG